MMETIKIAGPRYVLGLCPGCESWQLDYSLDEVGASTPQELHEIIEHILGEHLDECPHLQRLMDTL